jgi:hypothetical protein
MLVTFLLETSASKGAQQDWSILSDIARTQQFASSVAR